MDAGLRARTKQFIEFGLKISFTPCLPIRISGEVRGHACHAEHDKTFSKITFFPIAKK